MPPNPETKITVTIRKHLETRGAHFVKLSDSFTRGVPDALVVTNRPVMVEFKVDRLVGTDMMRTYRSLGLSGAQDHHIKALHRRCLNSAAVVTNTARENRLRVWVPLNPHDEKNETYICIAEGWREFDLFMGVA